MQTYDGLRQRASRFRDAKMISGIGTLQEHVFNAIVRGYLKF